MTGGVLVVPPSWAGSLGDEAMVRGAVIGLRGRARIGAWERGGPRLRRGESLMFIGADVIDGRYDPDFTARRLGFVEEAARSGARVAIVSASFSDGPSAVPPSVAIVCRDPLSRARAEAALQRPVGLAADLSFLLPPALAAPRRGGIGLCPNRLATRMLRCDAASYVDLHVDLIDALPDARWVLFGHDRRGDPSDFDLARAIAAARGLEVVSPAAIGSLDVVVTGRMHAGIAAIAAGVPALCMDYAGKVEGLATLAGYDLAWSPSDLFTPGALAARAASLIGERLHVASRLAELAAENLRPFER